MVWFQLALSHEEGQLELGKGESREEGLEWTRSWLLGSCSPLVVPMLNHMSSATHEAFFIPGRRILEQIVFGFRQHLNFVTYNFTSCVVGSFILNITKTMESEVRVIEQQVE